MEECGREIDCFLLAINFNFSFKGLGFKNKRLKLFLLPTSRSNSHRETNYSFHTHAVALTPCFPSSWRRCFGTSLWLQSLFNSHIWRVRTKNCWAPNSNSRAGPSRLPEQTSCWHTSPEIHLTIPFTKVYLVLRAKIGTASHLSEWIAQGRDAVPRRSLRDAVWEIDWLSQQQFSNYSNWLSPRIARKIKSVLALPTTRRIT